MEMRAAGLAIALAVGMAAACHAAPAEPNRVPTGSEGARENSSPGIPMSPGIPVKLGGSLPAMRTQDDDYYPTISKRLGESGSILLEFNIDTSGLAHNVVVIAGQSERLRTAALTLLKQSRFAVTADWDRAGPSSRRFRLSVDFMIEPCPRVHAERDVGHIGICVRKSVWVPDSPGREPPQATESH